ncbi:hypothetical protein QR680_012696 [Steinernema hermaphroditum]|uniref:Uncharacterized protein n=1 Tax=Steinernema hermaphroditum TaxID=289476 RepID=A0AA39M0X9_9BILA|nr:hypothetical protein QR680_012696 [Steinernema hermaphroditum]
MQDEQLRSLFNSVLLLSQEGEVPVQALAVLVQTARPEALVEQLHQKWLADQSFTPIAAQMLLQLQNMDRRDATLASGCLVMILNDYRNRLEMRNQSRLMFRNSIRALHEFYPVYRRIDTCLAQSLVKPIFHCMDILLDDDPDEADVQMAAQLLLEFGRTMHSINMIDADELVMKTRRILIGAKNATQVSLSTATKALLLRVMDMWQYGWDENMFPDCVHDFYSTLAIRPRSESESTESTARRKNDVDEEVNLSSLKFPSLRKGTNSSSGSRESVI